MIIITGPPGVTKPGEPMIFTADVRIYSQPDKLRYNWSISGGSLVSGQGTKRIEIGTTMADDQTNITATVKIESFPSGCPNTASEKAGVVGIHDEFPIDGFLRLSKIDIRARVDNLFIHLGQNPEFEAVFVIKFDKKEGRSFRIGFLKDIYDAIIFRRKDPARTSFIVSESEAETEAQVWMRPANASQEVFRTPGSILIKGEELKAKLKTLFTKKAQ